MKTKIDTTHQDQFHSILHILKYSITLLVITAAMMLVFFLMMGRLKTVVYKLEKIEVQLQNIEQKLSSPSMQSSGNNEHKSSGIEKKDFICDSKNLGCINAIPFDFKYSEEFNTSSWSCEGTNGTVIACEI